MQAGSVLVAGLAPQAAVAIAIPSSPSTSLVLEDIRSEVGDSRQESHAIDDVGNCIKSKSKNQWNWGFEEI